jgi:hypothetical protein
MATMTDLRHVLARVPDASPVEDLGAAIADSVAYLGSDAALASVEADPYWPKWHSPWWHMVTLWELGEARQIPARIAAAMVEALDALPIKIFPIHPGEVPSPEMWRLTTCHCALGSMVQVLTACGIDTFARLPWIEPWFLRYQMADGGLNCDDTAYLVAHECPSSMVGTITPFEAMLLGPSSAASSPAPDPERETFLDRAAKFLIERRLMDGSPTAHNAAERDREALWLAPCFPRLYYYDVLRGLAALVRWAHGRGRSLPRRSIEGVVTHLAVAFPDGVIQRRREGFSICPTTWRRSAQGAWLDDQPISRFPLLDAASAIGGPSAALTRQWSATRRTLIELDEAGRITE